MTDTEIARRKKIAETLKRRFEEDPALREQRRITSTGRKHSASTKEKLSELRRGAGNGMFRKTHSEEARKAISRANKGKVTSEETKAKISQANKGKPVSEEQRRQIADTLCRYYSCHTNPWKGRKHTEESKQKMSVALFGKFRGSLASNWRGGISSLPYAQEWTCWLKQQIRERDEERCQNPDCDRVVTVLDVHHIDYNKKNNSPNNLITLCKRCHGKTQHHRNRWRRFYQHLMES